MTPTIHFDDAEHRYWLIESPTQRRELASVSGIIRAAGYSGDTSYFKHEHRVRGTAVHEATQLVDARPSDWERHIQLQIVGGHAESYAAFLRDHKVTWRLREQIVFDPILGTAGRVDGVADVDDIVDAIIDFKSGGDDPCHGVQTAAYERMAPKTLPFIRKRFVLLLQADGSRAKLVPKTDRSDYDAFLAAVHTYYWRQRHGRLR